MFSEGSVKLCGLTWMNTEGSSSILLVIFSRRYLRYTASPSCPIESSFFPDWSKLGFDCASLTSSLLSLATKFVLTSLWTLLYCVLIALRSCDGGSSITIDRWAGVAFALVGSNSWSSIASKVFSLLLTYLCRGGCSTSTVLKPSSPCVLFCLSL